MTPAAGTIPETSQTTPAGSPEPAAPPPADITEGQIVKLMDMANGAEVDQSKVAQTRATNPKVKNFAVKMLALHGKAEEKGDKLATKLGLQPTESVMAMRLESETQSMIASLESAPAADFDRTYMAAQVEAHQKALSAIDEQLIPNVKNPELKKLLQEMRKMVESHLMEAQQIQSELAP